MQFADSVSWKLTVDQRPQRLYIPLWFRAAERIDIPAGGNVPGPLILQPLPTATSDVRDAAELAAGWTVWWASVVESEGTWIPPGPPPTRAFDAPDFAGLTDWPTLRRVAQGRWTEARDWSNDRSRAGIQAGKFMDMRANEVVTEVEQALGRRARPFTLSLLVVPVEDDQPRVLGPDRYLVPESFYDGPLWPDALRRLVSARA